MKRTAAHWAAFALSLVAVLAVAVAVQAFAEIKNHRFDLTEENRLSLSPYTLSVLKEVRDPLRVELYYQRGQRQRSQDLLALMHDNCSNLSYELVDLDRNPGRAKDHKVDHYDRAVLSYQGRETVVPAGDEETLTGGIVKVLHAKPSVLYFINGHRERQLIVGKDEDYGRASQLLRNESYDVRPLSLLHSQSVPADASAVVLAGPEVDLLDTEIAELETYLVGGGAVLALIDPVPLPNLSAWLAGHGLTLRDDVVIDRANRVYGSDGTNVVVPFYREHEAVRAMDVPVVLGRARSVSLPSGEDDDAASRATIVARTADESFAATGAARTTQGEVLFNKETDRPGPIGVMGVALIGNGPSAGRLAVIGDADFASDGYISLLGNKDLLVNTLGWMALEEFSGARPREENTKLGPVSPVYVTDHHARVIFLSTVVAEPLLFLGVGIAVVVQRRRRR
ncbi:MAG TPA: GldG family protein [Candidatus Bathyarchaeia archaeon]|nr:GldG family protein [Candidatus Bathyarchaeia archaeon]